MPDTALSRSSAPSLLSVSQRQERFSTLMRMFQRSFPSAPALARSLMTEALELATELDRRDQIAESLNNLGLCALELREYSDALPLFQRSFRVYRELGETERTAAVMLAIGSAQARLHLYPASVESYRESLRLCGECGSVDGKAVALSALGNVHADVGDYAAALEYHAQALNLRDAGADRNALGIVHSDIGFIYALMEEFDRALESFANGLALFVETGNHYLQARALGNIGSVYLSRGELSIALEHALRVLVLHERLDDEKGLAESLISAAMIYQRLHRLDDAVDYSLRALRIAESLGDERLRASALMSVGNLYRERGEQWNAIASLDRALEIARRLADRHLEFQIHRNMSRAFEDLGDPDRAFEHYKEFVRVRDELQGEEKRRAVAEIEVRLALGKAELDRETYRLRAEQLQSEMEHKAKELTAMALSIVQKNETLDALKERLTSNTADGPAKNRAMLVSVIDEIDAMRDAESDWKTFEQQLDRLHHDFVRTFAERYPDLTPAELKVCALLKTNLTTKDIANLLYLSERTVENHRYRIRRKMGLPADANLTVLLAGWPPQDARV